jgi:PAS domain S-box-containing protein
VRCAVAELWYLRIMSGNNNKPYWVIDLKTREVLEYNESAASMWGYAPGEMVGMRADRLIHADEAERAQEVRNEHVSGDIGTWKCIRKDGSVFFAHLVVRRGVRDGRLCAFAEAAS